METDKSQIHFGHGMSVQQIEKLRDQQSGKDLTPIKYFPANRLSVVKDKFVLDQFGDYEVAEHEKNSYHIFQEARSFNPTTGEKTSVGTVQIYTIDTFRQLEKAKAFKAFTVVIIMHDPTFKEPVKEKVTPPSTNDDMAPTKSSTTEDGNSFVNDDLAAKPATEPIKEGTPPKKKAARKKASNKEAQK